MGGQESRGMCCMKSAQSLSVSTSRGGSRLVAIADPSSMPSTYAVTNWRKDESLGSNNSGSITSLRSTKSKTKGSKQSKRPSLNVCTESMNGSQQLTADGCSLSELQFQGERGSPSLNLEQIISDVSAFFNARTFESSNNSPAFERAYIQSAEPSELTIYLKNEQSLPSKSKYFTLVVESIHRNVSNLQQFLDLGVPLLSFESQDPFLHDQSDIISGIDQQPLPILQQSHSLQQQPSNSNQIIQNQKIQHKASLDNSVSTNQLPQKNIKSVHITQQQQQSQSSQLPLSLSQQLSQQTPNTPNSTANPSNDQSKILYSWGDLSTKGILVQVIRSLFQRQHFSKPRELTYVKIIKIIDPNTCLIACQSTSALNRSKLSELDESDSLNLTAQQSKPTSPLKKSMRKTSGSQISSAASSEDKIEKAQLMLSGMLISYNSIDKGLKVSEMSSLDLHIDTSHYVQRQLIIHRQKKQFQALQAALAK